MGAMVIIGAGQGAGQALSKQYLSGELPLEKVYVRPEKFYTDKNIDLRTNTRVTSIDSEQHTVTTAAGESISYDKLMIATGSRPRILNIDGSTLEGIHYLRTIADVDKIRESMANANSIVIVGGGYIGLEVASVAVTAGKTVSVLEMEERILQRVTTPEMSAYYHQLHESRGLNILTKTTVGGFKGKNGTVTSVVCGDTEIPADLVIVGIGIIPNIELAEEAGLACDNGIVVDEHCQTTNPDIYAIGDCTNHPNPLLKRRLRLESVPNAMEQARVAVSNMLGGEKIYSAVPWFWSDQYELKLQMVGFSADGDTQVMRGDKSTNEFAVFYLKDGKVVAVDAVNAPREFMVAKQLYGQEVDPAVLADPATDLKTLVKR